MKHGEFPDLCFHLCEPLWRLDHHHPVHLYKTSRVPVEGKSSVCLTCMNYRILFLIIIIISLGQILLSYIANTSRTHACRRVCTHPRERVHTPPPHTPPSLYRYSMGMCQPTVTARSAGDNSWSLAIEINTGGPVSPKFWVFFAYKKMVGRTDTWTRQRIYCQTVRTVRDISRDNRARIATCSLWTPTDRQT